MKGTRGRGTRRTDAKARRDANVASRIAAAKIRVAAKLGVPIGDLDRLAAAWGSASKNPIKLETIAANMLGGPVPVSQSQSQSQLPSPGTFIVTRPVTGRLSTSMPNLQNLPARLPAPARERERELDHDLDPDLDRDLDYDVRRLQRLAYEQRSLANSSADAPGPEPAARGYLHSDSAVYRSGGEGEWATREASNRARVAQALAPILLEAGVSPLQVYLNRLTDEQWHLACGAAQIRVYVPSGQTRTLIARDMQRLLGQGNGGHIDVIFT